MEGKESEAVRDVPGMEAEEMTDREKKTGVITIYDGWVILVDGVQWILAKDYGKKDKRGNPVRDVRGYYTRLRKALSACCEANIHSKLQNGTQTLGEALHTIKKEHDRMEQFIAVNIPEV